MSNLMFDDTHDKKTAWELQAEKELGDFHVYTPAEWECRYPSRNQRRSGFYRYVEVRLLPGGMVIEFDNHPYVRAGEAFKRVIIEELEGVYPPRVERIDIPYRHFPCAYRSTPSGVWDPWGEFLVIFDPFPEKCQIGERVMAWNPPKAENKEVEGYVSAVPKLRSGHSTAFVISNKQGKFVGYFERVRSV